MRMFHRLYNPANRPKPRKNRGRRKNQEGAEYALDKMEGIPKGAPIFRYKIESPKKWTDPKTKKPGRKYRWTLYSLAGDEIVSGKSDSALAAYNNLVNNMGTAYEMLQEQKREAGIGGPVEVQTFEERETIFPGQVAKSPAEEYEGFNIFIRRATAEELKIHELPPMTVAYFFHASSEDGEYVSPEVGPIYPDEDTPDPLAEAQARAHMAAGMLSGMRETLKSNPDIRKKLARKANAYMRKHNPNGPGAAILKTPVTAEEIGSLASILQVPRQPEKAMLMGYYAGILRGIATCGPTKIIERFKIKRRTKKLLDEAYNELIASLAAPRR